MTALINEYSKLLTEHAAVNKTLADVRMELYDLIRQNDNGEGLCYTMCNTREQNYVGVSAYNFGGCFCDNAEGKLMQDGYEYMLFLDRREPDTEE